MPLPIRIVALILWLLASWTANIWSQTVVPPDEVDPTDGAVTEDPFGIIPPTQSPLPLDPSDPHGLRGSGIPPQLLQGAAPGQPPPPPEELLNPSRDIGDIRDNWPFPRWPWWVWALIAAGGVLLWLSVGLLLLFIFRKRKGPPPISAFDQFLFDLNDARQLINRGQDRDFALAVSLALRRYLQAACRLHALDRTTEELDADEALRQRFGEARRGELFALLDAWDLAKYAGQPLGPHGMRELADRAEQWVQRTHLQSDERADIAAPEATTAR